ncbi:hypothetical protein ACH4U6_36060 [Streptomyces netropsis]|uniref:hypothetical protein n=1 Tax=Streptomyces netropsis TaxID=55404 RepID=UPI0037A1C224
MTGGEQAAKGFAFASEPGLDQMLAGECLLGCPDGVDHVRLAAAADGGLLGAADGLHDALTGA